jgi:hypothetical protein
MNQFATRAAISRGSLVLMIAAAALTAGCNGGGGGGNSASDTKTAPATAQSPSPSATNTPPSISASPVTAVSAGQTYSFTPVAQDPDGDVLAFAIENRPEWAQFSTVTGELVGTPSASHAGVYEDIKISVSDGKTTVALDPFSINVGAMSAGVPSSGTVLQWDLPMLSEDGQQQLSSLAGVRIHYGKTADALAETIEIRNPGVASYVVEDLPAGTYYFAVRAFTETGEQSALSNVISKVIG